MTQVDDNSLEICWKLLGKECNAVENPSGTDQTG